MTILSDFMHALSIAGFDIDRIEAITTDLNIRRFTTLKSLSEEELAAALQ